MTIFADFGNPSSVSFRGQYTLAVGISHFEIYKGCHPERSEGTVKGGSDEKTESLTEGQILRRASLPQNDILCSFMKFEIPTAARGRLGMTGLEDFG